MISTKIIERVGKNLALLKKRANVSFEKISFVTNISLSHVRNACSGEANITILYLQEFASFFGVKEALILEEDAKIPTTDVLQKNIEIYLTEKGFATTHNFKELGPTYIVEDYILKSKPFKNPLLAAEIKDLINENNGTSYKTNDVSRVLNNLLKQGIIKKIQTPTPKKPKYNKISD